MGIYTSRLRQRVGRGGLGARSMLARVEPIRTILLKRSVVRLNKDEQDPRKPAKKWRRVTGHTLDGGSRLSHLISQLKYRQIVMKLVPKQLMSITTLRRESANLGGLHRIYLK